MIIYRVFTICFEPLVWGRVLGQVLDPILDLVLRTNWAERWATVLLKADKGPLWQSSDRDVRNQEVREQITFCATRYSSFTTM